MAEDLKPTPVLRPLPGLRIEAVGRSQRIVYLYRNIALERAGGRVPVCARACNYADPVLRITENAATGLEHKVFLLSELQRAETNAWIAGEKQSDRRGLPRVN